MSRVGRYKVGLRLVLLSCFGHFQQWNQTGLSSLYLFLAREEPFYNWTCFVFFPHENFNSLLYYFYNNLWTLNIYFYPLLLLLLLLRSDFFILYLLIKIDSHMLFFALKKKSHLGLCKDKALNPSSSYLLYNIGKSPSEPRFEQTRKTNYYFWVWGVVGIIQLHNLLKLLTWAWKVGMIYAWFPIIVKK